MSVCIYIYKQHIAHFLVGVDGCVQFAKLNEDYTVVHTLACKSTFIQRHTVVTRPEVSGVHIAVTTTPAPHK